MQSLAEATKRQMFEEAGCLIPRHGLQITIAKVFKMNISGSYRDDNPKNVIETAMSRYWSRDRVFKFADVIRAKKVPLKINMCLK